MTATHEVQGPLGPSTQFAPFFQRLLAFVVDGFLLGLVGQVLGLVLGAPLSRAGGWGWTIGFAVVVGYLGVLNSRVGGGQSIGKRVAKIRVVGSDGNPIGLGRSLGRAIVLSAPYFLADAPLDIALATRVAAIVSYLALGLGLSIVYLFVFNRPTRQSLHDRLAGTYVVLIDSALAPGPRPLAWGHYAVVAAILVLTVAMQLGVRQLGRAELYASLAAAQEAIAKEPAVVYARMSAQTSINIENGRRSSRQVLLVRVVVRLEVMDAGAVANKAVRIVLDTVPEAAQMDEITVLIAKGYDIGIANFMTTREFSLSPSRWRERIGP